MIYIPVVEIFGCTIQGEGPNAGARCIFVRVKGCDYSCSFCDSKFTWTSNPSETSTYSIEDLSSLIVSRCEESHCHRVVLTGGNPCLYDFTFLINACHRHSIYVDVETQGSLMPKWLEDIDTIVFSPKPPSSGMHDTYRMITNFIETVSSSRNQSIAIKVPVFDDADIEFSRNYAKWVKAYKEVSSKDVRLYLSVGNSDVTTTESIRDRVLFDYEALLTKINNSPEYFENVFILPQIHTLVWGNKQGV